MTVLGMESQMPRLQALALSLSGCSKKGGVTCMTCHNPHQDAGATPRATYNAQCVSCHNPSTPTHQSCPEQPAGDCVSCHMPAQDVGMPTSPKFRTHWIKVWREMQVPSASTSRP